MKAAAKFPRGQMKETAVVASAIPLAMTVVEIAVESLSVLAMLLGLEVAVGTTENYT